MGESLVLEELQCFIICCDNVVWISARMHIYLIQDHLVDRMSVVPTGTVLHELDRLVVWTTDAARSPDHLVDRASVHRRR